MKKVILAIGLILIAAGFAWGQTTDPKPEDYVGWYILHFTSMTYSDIPDRTMVMVLGDVVYIYHVANGVYRQYTLIPPRMRETFERDGMSLRIFNGL